MEIDKYLNDYADTRRINNLWVRVLPEEYLSRIKKDTGFHDRKKLDEMILNAGVIPEIFVPLYQSGITYPGIISLLYSNVFIEGMGTLGKETAQLLSRNGIGKITGLDVSFDEKEVQSKICEDYEGTELSLVKNEIKPQNIEDLIPKHTNLVISTGQDPQVKFIIQEYCRNNNMPLLCTMSVGSVFIIVPVFSSTKDITGLISNFVSEGKMEDIFVKNISPLIVDESLKILLNGSSNLNGSIIYVDFSKNIFKTVPL